MKKLWLLGLATAVFCWSTVVSPAAPPVGDQGPEYYSGIWRLTLDDTCFRHVDGTASQCPITSLYLVLAWNEASQTYSGEVYSDLDGARTCDPLKRTGDTALDFEFPGASVSYLTGGYGNVLVDQSGFTGNCEVTLQGALRTSVRSSQIRVRSWIMGGNLAWCRPDDAAASALACSGTWLARWIEIAPDCGRLGTDEGDRSVKICAGDPVPASYIWVDDRWDPSQCGNPSSITYNVWTVEKYGDKPVGSTMSACDAAPTPTGWVKISDKWDPQRCGHPSSNIKNVKTIKRLE